MNELEKLGVKELSDILNTLQERITTTPYEQEATILRGSYGVHLHFLRRRDEQAATPYVNWMRDLHAGKY